MHLPTMTRAARQLNTELCLFHARFLPVAVATAVTAEPIGHHAGPEDRRKHRYSCAGHPRNRVHFLAAVRTGQAAAFVGTSYTEQ